MTLFIIHICRAIATQTITTTINNNTYNTTYQFTAGEFFQNNMYVLPLMITHVLRQAKGGNSHSNSDNNTNSTTSAPTPTTTATTATPPSTTTAATSTATTTVSTASTNSKECNILIDTYCGSGLFALSASHMFTHIYGVEVSKQAIQAAQRSANLNNITNTKFITGVSEDIFGVVNREIAVGEERDRTVVIIDPPRAGIYAVYSI